MKDERDARAQLEYTQPNAALALALGYLLRHRSGLTQFLRTVTGLSTRIVRRERRRPARSRCFERYGTRLYRL